MTKFAFIIHPISAKGVAKKYPIARYLPDRVIEFALRGIKPQVTSQITGIKSKTGATTEGIFIGLALTPRMFMDDPVEHTMDRLVQCAQIAEKEGAKIIGLGAFTSIVGDGGITVAKRSNIAVTTGNSYTVATAIEGTLKACHLIGIDTKESTLAIVGATGSIGRTCAIILAEKFKHTLLLGRDLERTQKVAEEVQNAEATTDFAQLKQADVVITVTSTESEVVMPQHLKHGAIVCDVARPRDVSIRVQRERPDVLTIEGGVVKVPGDHVDFGFNFGFPPGTAYACMSETIMLALEDRPENFTLGKTVSVEQVKETWALAEKHGFEVAGFRSFEREVSEATIRKVKELRSRPVAV